MPSSTQVRRAAAVFAVAHAATGHRAVVAAAAASAARVPAYSNPLGLRRAHFSSDNTVQGHSESSQVRQSRLNQTIGVLAKACAARSELNYFLTELANKKKRLDDVVQQLASYESNYPRDHHMLSVSGRLRYQQTLATLKSSALALQAEIEEYENATGTLAKTRQQLALQHAAACACLISFLPRNMVQEEILRAVRERLTRFCDTDIQVDTKSEPYSYTVYEEQADPDLQLLLSVLTRLSSGDDFETVIRETSLALVGAIKFGDDRFLSKAISEGDKKWAETLLETLQQFNGFTGTPFSDNLEDHLASVRMCLKEKTPLDCAEAEVQSASSPGASA